MMTNVLVGGRRVEQNVGLRSSWTKKIVFSLNSSEHIVEPAIKIRRLTHEGTE